MNDNKSKVFIDCFYRGHRVESNEYNISCRCRECMNIPCNPECAYIPKCTQCLNPSKEKQR